MTVHYNDEAVTLHLGDCLDVLTELPDNSIDSVCTDPPYGLANTDPAHVTDALVRWINGERDFMPEGAGFMGKSWDAFVPPPAVWDECLRVLKPGGHLLCFAGTRTVDLMGLSIRLAGFEIRDSLAWIYGSGFPKSLDVGKAIDKMAGAEREVIGRQTGRAAYGYNPEKITHAPGGMFRWGDQHYSWAELPENARAYFTTAAQRKGDITAPATPAAQQWAGWHTALKPAFEPVIVARKPFPGTVATNVLTHGTGALNIDGTRVGGAWSNPSAGAGSGVGTTGRHIYGSGLGGVVAQPHTAGRWPANVLLDEGMAAQLDQESGNLPTQKTRATLDRSGDGGIFGLAGSGARTTPGAGESGGASRFFKVFEPDDFPVFRYQAKAPTSERPSYEREGAGDPSPLSPKNVRQCNACGSKAKANADRPWPTCGHEDWQWVPQERGGIGKVAHATVKPLALMRWLVKLVTPPGGTCLEPFAGSGTTVEAAILEGFRCVAIEREPDYLPLIRQRIDRAHAQAATTPTADPTLFDEESA